MQAQNISLIPLSYGIYSVRLDLEFQSRFIGNFDSANKIFVSTPRSSKHIFRRTSSLGISKEVLNLPINLICVPFENKKLFITRSHCLKVGKYFCFDGYEKQLFVPANEFSKSEDEAIEKQSILFPQFSLFPESVYA